MKKNSLANIWLSVLILFTSCLYVSNAQAVPSFARQTGLNCAVCHTVFPELTPFGRQFKMLGYSMSGKGKWDPLSALLQASATSTRHTGNAAPDNFPRNNELTLQQASLFYAGKLADHAGAFVQWTYDGVEHHSALDLTDIRYANQTTLGGHNTLYGLTLNNNPTVQDVWNSTPVWGFPYAASSVAVMPAASTLIEGGLASQVGGISAYTFWNHMLYGELGLYHTANTGFYRPLGAGTPTTSVIKGDAPYWRLAAEHAWGNNSAMIGTFGLVTDLYPDPDNLTGPTDRFRDIGLDMQYQHIKDPHIFTADASFIHERQDWNASFPLGNTANPSDTLRSFKVKGSYYYQRRYGASLAWFQTGGSADPGLYAPEEVSGSRTGKPDSSGWIAELDYLPRENIKLSLQYTAYDKFNGAGTNYDGLGRNASDNNTTYLLAWLMF